MSPGQAMPALLCVALTTGCLAPAVLDRTGTRTHRETYRTTIESVAQAERLGSGALRMCLEIRGLQDEQKRVQLEIPLQWLDTHRERASLDFGRDEGFETRLSDGTPSLHYVFFEEDRRADWSCRSPQGPAIDTNSPLQIWRSIFVSAWVSTSSVSNTLPTLAKRTSVASLILLRHEGPTDLAI
jgi:hypothetical protein